MGRPHRVWFPRVRAGAARALRPLCVRWPFALGRASMVRRLVPTIAQLPVGRAARMRPGFRLHIRADPVYRALWLFGEFDPWESAFYARFLRPGETAVDVGANFGWHTLGFARAVSPGGRVLAFEPVPTTREHLAANLALNGVADQVVVHPCAVGATAGPSTIYTFAGASLAEASGSALGRDDATPHAVTVVTLDAMLAADGGALPALVKVDVEGFELAVFRGAAVVLAFEVNRSCLAHLGVTGRALHAHLRGTGYSAFWRVEPGRGAVAAADLEWTGRPDHRNFVAAKAAAIDRVRAAL